MPSPPSLPSPDDISRLAPSLHAPADAIPAQLAALGVARKVDPHRAPDDVAAGDEATHAAVEAVVARVAEHEQAVARDDDRAPRAVAHRSGGARPLPGEGQ